METNKVKKNWKQKISHEVNEYLINFIYMGIVFSAIVLYRRLVLAEHGIYLTDYFTGFINALIIAKVVMIGAFLNISRKFEHRPLIIPTLYKAILFTILVMVFNIIEVLIRGLIKTGSFINAIEELKIHIDLAWLGVALLIFIIFIPFFGFKELARALGREKIFGIFLKNQNTSQV